jgi:hypothetical protein
MVCATNVPVEARSLDKPKSPILGIRSLSNTSWMHVRCHGLLKFFLGTHIVSMLWLILWVTSTKLVRCYGHSKLNICLNCIKFIKGAVLSSLFEFTRMLPKSVTLHLAQCASQAHDIVTFLCEPPQLGPNDLHHPRDQQSNNNKAGRLKINLCHSNKMR